MGVIRFSRRQAFVFPGQAAQLIRLSDNCARRSRLVANPLRRYNAALLRIRYIGMELNPHYNKIKDLQARLESLRGYL